MQLLTAVLLLLVWNSSQAFDGLDVPKKITVDSMTFGEEVLVTVPLNNSSTKAVDIMLVTGPFSKVYKWSGDSRVAPGGKGEIVFIYEPLLGKIDHDVFIYTVGHKHAIRLTGNCENGKSSESENGKVRTISHLNGQKMKEYRDLRSNTSKPRPETASQRSLTTWYRNGQKRMVAATTGNEWKVSFFHPNGQKAGLGMWKGKPTQPKYTGEWTTWHDNGKIESKGKYKNGFRIGYWEFFYPDGTLKSRARYKKSSGFKSFNASEKEAAAKANIQVKGGYRKGSHPLWYEEYYPDGQKKFDFTFIGKDESNGMFSAFFPNGQLNSQRFIKKGKTSIDRLFCEDGIALYDRNEHRSVDIKADNVSVACKGTINLLEYAPRLSEGILFFEVN